MRKGKKSFRSLLANSKLFSALLKKSQTRIQFSVLAVAFALALSLAYYAYAASFTAAETNALALAGIVRAGGIGRNGSI